MSPSFVALRYDFGSIRIHAAGVRVRSIRSSSIVALLALALGAVAPSASAATPKGPDFVRPIVRVDDRSTATVLPLHAPVPANSTGIGPGSQILIDRPDGSFLCTANFIWTKTDTTQTRKRNGKPNKKAPPTVTKTLYLGAAGHCFLPTDKASTHGPDADFDPALATVSVCVADCEGGGQVGAILGTFAPLGPVRYARQTKGGVDVSNDFGIVEIPSSIPRDSIRPSVPVWEGPSSVEDVSEGGGVCVYGNAAGLGEIFLTKARAGIGTGLGSNGRYWKAILPSFQGDSGSALVTCGPDDSGLHGFGAAGILTHISGEGIVGTTTSRAVEMTKDDAGIAMQLMLEDGTEVTPPPPPAATALTPNEEVHPVAMGGSYGWEAGPFNRLAPPEAFFFGEECSGTEPASDHCDYEFVDLAVPAGGALLTVTVSTEDATGDDFDLFVYDPDGELVGSKAAAGTPPEVVSEVVLDPGVYTIGVDPFDATDASYSGLVELDERPPPEPEVFDGEASPGAPYSWTGTPPLPVNPLFTCAEPVNAFCDDELVKVHVPSGGGTLAVDVAADAVGDDFDLCIYPPNGGQFCSSEAGDEHFQLPVTLTGVYRVGVKSFLAPQGGYSGVAAIS